MSGWIKKHGLSRNTKRVVFDALFTRQGGKCAICGISDKALRRCSGPMGAKNVHYRLYIDHCHMTGMIRGLLCNGCNLMLSILESSRAWFSPQLKQDCERWHVAYVYAITDYMQYDRWLPAKDIVFRLQAG